MSADLAGPARTSVYHCGECERVTDVDGSTVASGSCPVTGGLHVVDLEFHHRHAHDVYDPDPDCFLCTAAGPPDDDSE